MGCGCKKPVIRNPKPEIKQINNGESETNNSTSGTTTNQ